MIKQLLQIYQGIEDRVLRSKWGISSEKLTFQKESVAKLKTYKFYNYKEKSLNGLNTRLGRAEEINSHVTSTISVEISKTKEAREKRLRENEQSLREAYGSIRHSRVHAIEGPEGDGRESIERSSGILIPEYDEKCLPKVPNTQQLQARKDRDTQKNPPGYFLLKLLKTKQRREFEANKREAEVLHIGKQSHQLKP